MDPKPLKRHLFPVPLPPAKRQHGARPYSSKCIITFDSALYDELILFIFTFLNSRDLCAIQATNRNCSRLSCDHQLWKTLFVRDFGKARLRGGRGFYNRADGRLVRPLPSRASVPADESLDWKWMYRISSNWRNGRCAVESLSDSAPIVVPPTADEGALLARHRFHVLLAGTLIISASSEASHHPIIFLRTRGDILLTLKCRSSVFTRPVNISTIAIDQSPPLSRTSKQHSFVRFASFLSTGEFSIYEYDSFISTPLTSPKLTYTPSSHHRSHVMQAAYHHPLLVTLSHEFTLTLYDLSGDSVTPAQSLNSFTSYPPTSLVLSAIPSSTSYKLILAYAIPVHPFHWSVGVTELIISSLGSVTSSPTLFSGAGPVLPSLGSFTVTRTRSVRAFDVPQGWIDDQRLEAMRAQWGRKVKQVADIQTDGKWIVLGPGDFHEPSPCSSHDEGSSSDSSDSLSSSSYVSPPGHTSTQLQLYRLHMPASSSSHAPKLTFVRTLHGPLGAISALSLADGRCVSLGVNGSIWVWDLEAGEGTEVAGPVKGFKEPRGRGTVVFDERHIVSSRINGIEERRFDI
ncbi:hypothetical protein PAXRUDRAFT_15808 [Paxillus rubicundulus Ve08.2h10]|uniref:F-box domain-containing protein n=1 Tax=Paxillus rubicundulus Ve08.2h10 TaxID=930991 RepID=A0A0D0DNY3_9AGAM|nr:hypothetical protein PAXRUDRAFT_15808 [Paxillus rubicundulus Ve08.2h10]